MLRFKNKKIVFVINSLEGGGAEKVLCNWLMELEAEFLEANIDVHLILLDDLEHKNIPPDYVKITQLNSGGSFYTGFKLLKRAIGAMSPDLVISFLTRSNLLSTPICRIAKIPVVLSERVHTTQHFGNSLKGKLSRLLIRFIYPSATKIIAVSHGVKADLVNHYGVNSEKCTVVYNAYNIDALAEQANGDVNYPVAEYCVGIGRLVDNKNFELLLSAINEADLTLPLLLLGEGENEPKLKQQAADLGIAERVHFMGYVKNPYPYLKNASFLVSTSNAEGFPNGIAESICLSTPVLSTNCESGPAEILASDYNFSSTSAMVFDTGILVPTNNKKEVARGLLQIKELVQNNKFSAASLRSKADEFSFSTLKKSLFTLLNDTLGK